MCGTLEVAHSDSEDEGHAEDTSTFHMSRLGLMS